MSTIAAPTTAPGGAPNQKDAFIEDLSRRSLVDFDDFTSSSILEFLNKERECFNSNLDDASELDVESIFEEINRLSEGTDERSVEEILQEAQILMNQQQPLSSLLIDEINSNSSCTNYNVEQENSSYSKPPLKGTGVKNSKDSRGCGVDSNSNITNEKVESCSISGEDKRNENTGRKKKTHTTIISNYDDNSNDNEYNKNCASNSNKKDDFNKVIETVRPDSVISQESTSRELNNITSRDSDLSDPIEDLTETIDSVHLSANNDEQNKQLSAVIEQRFSNNYSPSIGRGSLDTEPNDSSAKSDRTITANSFDKDYQQTDEESSLKERRQNTKVKSTPTANKVPALFSSPSHRRHISSTTIQENSLSSIVMTRSISGIPDSPSHRKLNVDDNNLAKRRHNSIDHGILLQRKLSEDDETHYVNPKNCLNQNTVDGREQPLFFNNSSSSLSTIVLNKTFSRPNSTLSTYTEKSYCDKSTNSSPTRQNRSCSVTTKATSPMNDNLTLTREHLLKNEIAQLQEKLKDTEERLQSLRIQHDSLAQIHRDLRENHTHVQEESELLKLDVQHLNECANILRSELQAARNDRNEALDVQKTLRNELEESRAGKKRAIEQCEKDSKIIKDLQRQCKEMERILMRKHPDSVSALIVASKNPGKINDDSSSSRRLLEQRIAQLEADAKDQDLKAQKILANVQARFNSVQSKYETHIADLETQVLSLQEINTKLNEKIESQITSMSLMARNNKNLCNNYTQTGDIPERDRVITRTIQTQTDSRLASGIRPPQVRTTKGVATPNRSIPSSHSDVAISSHHGPSPSSREETHLLATIRGMRVDLAIKEKGMQRLTRELDECKKTIKKLQKERDALRSEKPGSSSSGGSSTASSLTGSRKLYDPNQYSADCQSSTVADNQHALKEAINKIKYLENDYKSLHDKRLQDLKTLQAAHERELASCHDTVRILQQRLSERDEAIAANQKRRKVPIDYYALKAKVSSLEKRHSEREQRLHMLVDALSKGRLNGALDEILNENTQPN